MTLSEVKANFIKVLQKYNHWNEVVDYKKAAKEMFENATEQEKEKIKEREGIIVDQIGVSYYEKILRPDTITQLLQDTNSIHAPIALDLSLELPFVELYIDKDNYCVFTTSRIYSCIDARLEIIAHRDIDDIDTLNYRPNNLRIDKFDLEKRDGSKATILFEKGIPLQSIAVFLSYISNANKP